jgi:phosphomannomutase
MIEQISDSAFGKNDIRGIYGKEITEDLFYYIGKGFVAYLVEQSKLLPSEVWVRLSCQMNLKALFFNSSKRV